ncbi:MAG TPA: hypothetical protein VGI82_04595, partial [Chitinophagaceae bacterium]
FTDHFDQFLNLLEIHVFQFSKNVWLKNHDFRESFIEEIVYPTQTELKTTPVLSNSQKFRSWNNSVKMNHNFQDFIGLM